MTTNEHVIVVGNRDTSPATVQRRSQQSGTRNATGRCFLPYFTWPVRPDHETGNLIKGENVLTVGRFTSLSDVQMAEVKKKCYRYILGYPGMIPLATSFPGAIS